jgi:hypothetical protein
MEKFAADFENLVKISEQKEKKVAELKNYVAANSS